MTRTTNYKLEEFGPNVSRCADHDLSPLMSTDLTVVKFSAVVSSPGSRQESSRVSSCSFRDQSTGRRYQVEYRSNGYETSVQEGPTLILHLLVQGEKSSSDTKSGNVRSKRETQKVHITPWNWF